MRELFPGHYRPDVSELSTLWEKAIFVFDTNVLLEIYVLPEKARDELLGVLEAIQDRLWVPYQVALEFHRRRFTKIRTASKGIADLRNKVKNTAVEFRVEVERMDFDKWNTGITDVPQILDQLTEIHQKLGHALEAAERKLPPVTLEDPIAARLADLLLGRIGNAPATQKELDQFFVEGAQRYAAEIPPGYSDAKKGDKYHDRGLVYEAKYGDFILWKQMLTHAAEQQLSHVIFVTADAKADWWYSERSGERLGPQPALIEEFLRETKADGFWIYTPDSFLEQARTQFSVQVEDRTVEQVKQGVQAAEGEWQERVEFQPRVVFPFEDADQLPFSGRRLLRQWVQDRHPSAALKAGLGGDIGAEEAGNLFAAYHIVRVRRLPIIAAKIAAIPLYSGVIHHVIVVLEEAAAPSLVFGADEIRSGLSYQLTNVMQTTGVASVNLVVLEHDELRVLAEFRHPMLS